MSAGPVATGVSSASVTLVVVVPDDSYEHAAAITTKAMRREEGRSIGKGG